MDATYIFLQQYWWFLVSLLGALLVFLLFVQGGNSLLFTLGRTEEERTMLVNSTGRKWEFTFTTLVTFGGIPVQAGKSAGQAYLSALSGSEWDCRTSSAGSSGSDFLQWFEFYDQQRKSD